MFKRLFLIIICIFIFFNIIPTKSYAFGPVAGAVARVVEGSVGERVVAGMAEKAGVKLMTKTAREKAVERWNLEMYSKIKAAEDSGKTAEVTQLRDFQTQLVNLADADVQSSSTPGLGKVVLSTAMFLTGADIIYDVYNSIKSAQDTQNLMKVRSYVGDVLADGEGWTEYGKYNIKYYADYVDVNNGTSNLYELPASYGQGLKSVGYFYKQDSDLMVYVYYSNRSVGWTEWNGIIGGLTSASFTGANYPWPVKQTPVSSGSVDPLPSTINPLLDPFTSAGDNSFNDVGDSVVTVPENYPQTVDINIPTTSDYPENVDVPWNDVISEVSTDPIPDPDPVPDPLPGTEPVDAPSFSDWWKWLFAPLAEILKLLQDLFEWLKNIFGQIPEWFSSILSKLADLLSNLTTWFSDLLSKLDDLLSNLTSWFSDLLSQLSGAFQTLWDWFSQILAGISGLVSSIVDGISNIFIPTDLNAVTQPISDIQTQIKGKFNSPSDFAWLQPALTESNCPDDIYIDFWGHHIKIVDLSIPCNLAYWWIPIMRGALWFFFGWWLFRKANAIMSRNGGVK